MAIGRTIGLVSLSVLFAGCCSTFVPPPVPVTQARFMETDAPCSGKERYYILVFASQSTPKLPRYTHTWASVVRVKDRGPNRPVEIDCQTLSWLATDLKVEPWEMRVRPGVNLALHPTLEAVRAQGERVALWGPYEIDVDLYRHVLAQKAFLESGKIGYQALDLLGEAGCNDNARNCIHALTDADERFGQPLWGSGETVTESIVKHLADQGALIDPARTHVWLIPALGLDGYPIIRHGPP
jgi:hypothetical protein